MKPELSIFDKTYQLSRDLGNGLDMTSAIRRAKEFVWRAERYIQISRELVRKRETGLETYS